MPEFKPKPKKPTPGVDTKQQEKFKDFDIPTNNPISKAKDPDPKPGTKNTPNQRTASKASTQAKVANLSMTDQMADLMSKLRDIGYEDEVSDSDLHTTYGYVDPETTENLPAIPANLPAIINKEVSEYDGMVHPEWHMVKNLPGYMQNGIRVLGRSLFSQFTKTKLEEIQVIACLAGQGPNTMGEINAVANWAKEHARRVDEAGIDFSNIMPGYNAKILQYSSKDVRLMIVKDDFGAYIYSWPESDSKSGPTLGNDSKSGPTLGNRSNQGRLR